MSKEKQIEEMAIELSKVNCKPSGCGFCYLEYGTLENSCEEYLVYKKMAQTLYNAGYRKQIEGEWKKFQELYPRYVCTACNHLFNNKEYKYCPNCGAKMK